MGSTPAGFTQGEIKELRTEKRTVFLVFSHEDDNGAEEPIHYAKRIRERSPRCNKQTYSLRGGD